MIKKYTTQYQGRFYNVEIDTEASEVVLAYSREDNCFINLEENQSLINAVKAYYEAGTLPLMQQGFSITKSKLLNYSQNAFGVWVDGTKKYAALRNAYCVRKYGTPFLSDDIEVNSILYPHWSHYLAAHIKGFNESSIQNNNGFWAIKSRAIDIAISEWEDAVSK